MACAYSLREKKGSWRKVRSVQAEIVLLKFKGYGLKNVIATYWQ